MDLARFGVIDRMTQEGTPKFDSLPLAVRPWPGTTARGPSVPTDGPADVSHLRQVLSPADDRNR